MPNEPILIVDDNPLNLKMEKKLLEMEGYQVLTAKGAEETLRLLECFRPSLILMDFQLPGVDGVELTKQLRKDPKHRETIILMATSYDQKGDEEKARVAGCDGYIHKPIDTQALPLLVAKFIKEGRLGGDRRS